jgi:hypothetical protein
MQTVYVKRKARRFKVRPDRVIKKFQKAAKRAGLFFISGTEITSRLKYWCDLRNRHSDYLNIDLCSKVDTGYDRKIKLVHYPIICKTCLCFQG